MHFGFAEIAPPASDTFKGKSLVAFAQPRPGVRIRDVKHAAFADPYFDFLRASGRILDQKAFRCKLIVVFKTASVAENVGLGYDDCVYIACLEIGKHFLVVGPLLLIPGQTPHVFLLAVPVEVEHDSVKRITSPF